MWNKIAGHRLFEEALIGAKLKPFRYLCSTWYVLLLVICLQAWMQATHILHALCLA